MKRKLQVQHAKCQSCSHTAHVKQNVPLEHNIQGQWTGNSFILYLQKHAIIITPYIQAKMAVHKAFIQYTMPLVC